MRLRLFHALAIAAWWFGCPEVAPARLVEDWPYERLFKKADLVVIATAVTNQPSSDRFADKRWPVTFSGVNTTLEVRQVLKGQAPAKTISLLHFRLPETGDQTDDHKEKPADPPKIVEVINGPTFVGFRTTTILVDIKDLVGSAQIDPDYLLFLKKRADGRYEPVSGRIAPGLSVRELWRHCRGQ